MKWLLTYLLTGICESVIIHDGVIEGNIASFIAFSLLWLPMNVIVAIKILMHPGEKIIDKECGDD